MIPVAPTGADVVWTQEDEDRLNAVLNWYYAEQKEEILKVINARMAKPKKPAPKPKKPC